MMPSVTRGGAKLEPLVYDAVAGWANADHGAAWTAFRESALRLIAGVPELRRASSPGPALLSACREATAMPERLAGADARGSFERMFEPRRIRPQPEPDESGLLTGYYEPVVDGALERRDGFAAPILSRPDVFDQGQGVIPDRAALEAYALSSEAKPVVWLRDWTEVFLIHVQGSARIRLPDGSQHRLVYTGRNGLPYTSIGRRLIETARIAEAEMSLDTLKTWLREHGQEPGQDARRLMQENRSYIFFRLEPADEAGAGPIGGQGLPLRPGVSIAVDRTLWSYGLPFMLESRTAVPGFGGDPFSGLFIAQDTGSAIVGPARADLFLGSGDQAGVAAGLVRHAATFTVLLPRDT